MHCKDFKHFDPDGGHLNVPTSGQCTRWHIGYSTKEWLKETNTVIVEGDEGWGNMVHGDFGCVLFEPSDQKENNDETV